MTDNKMDPMAAIFSVALMLYTNGSIELARKLFPDRHPQYQDEWRERFSNGFEFAVGYMDGTTFRRFCTLAFEEHGASAEEWMAATEGM